MTDHLVPDGESRWIGLAAAEPQRRQLLRTFQNRLHRNVRVSGDGESYLSPGYAGKNHADFTSGPAPRCSRTSR